MKMYVILLCLCFSSCTQNQKLPTKQKVDDPTSIQSSITNLTTQTPKITVPKWFLNLPEENVEAIGIARDKLYREEETRQLAKEHAAVLLSRCHGSFLVNKRATVTNDAEALVSDERSAQFNVTVSSDLAYLKQMADSLEAYDHFLLHNYYISLHGCKMNSFPKELVEISPDSIPDWCKQNAIQAQGAEVYSLGIGSSGDLISAWDKAYDIALKQLAAFKELKVTGISRETYDNQSKSIALETSTVLSDIKPVNHFVTFQTKEGMTTYQVWCRLKYRME